MMKKKPFQNKLIETIKAQKEAGETEQAERLEEKLREFGSLFLFNISFNFIRGVLEVSGMKAQVRLLKALLKNIPTERKQEILKELHK